MKKIGLNLTKKFGLKLWEKKNKSTSDVDKIWFFKLLTFVEIYKEI